MVLVSIGWFLSISLDLISYRTNRDDQSAFTFLIDEYFGHGTHNRRTAFLNPYVGSYWRQKSTMSAVYPLVANCTSVTKKIHKNDFKIHQSRRKYLRRS